MICMTYFDKTDARMLSALSENPRATGVDLASGLGLSRNTVQARMNRWESEGALHPIDHRIPPRNLGRPLLAFVTARVDQHQLGEVTDHLARIAEVIEVFGLAGETDLLIRVVAADTDDLYRIAGLVLGVPGVERTNIGIAMRELIAYRTMPLVSEIAGR